MFWISKKKNYKSIKLLELEYDYLWKCFLVINALMLIFFTAYIKLLWFSFWDFELHHWAITICFFALWYYDVKIFWELFETYHKLKKKIK